MVLGDRIIVRKKRGGGIQELVKELTSVACGKESKQVGMASSNMWYFR